MKKQTLCCTVATLLGLVLTALALWLCAARPALAAPIVRYVAGTGADGSNDCKNLASPCRTIQHAIDVAASEDAIHVAGGTYTSAGGPVATITKPLSIVGAFDPTFGSQNPDLYKTMLDGAWKSSVISIAGASHVALEFLTLTRGDGTDSCDGFGCGGGIYVEDTDLHVSGCTIIDNVGTRENQGLGGGIYSYYSNLIVESTQIVSNVANADPASSSPSIGGGIYALAGTATLAENQIVDNVAHVSFTGRGGGIGLVSVMDVQMMGNVIRDNWAVRGTISGYGGGVYIETATWFFLVNNRIEGNRATGGSGGLGGGVHLAYGNGHLTGNTIISNTAGGGGGVYVRSSNPITLSNNLVVRNRAGFLGGGVYAGSSTLPADQLVLVNNTIADNGDTGIGGWKYVELTLTNNLIAGHTTGISATAPASATITADTNLFWNTSDPITGTNAILQDPLLAPGYGLRPGSPAVDKGLTIPWLTVDLEGTACPQGSAYDVGAFEGERQMVFLPLTLRNSP
jgi:hypothetical protein